MSRCVVRDELITHLLTGLSNFRTEPSGSVMFTMFETPKEKGADEPRLSGYFKQAGSLEGFSPRRRRSHNHSQPFRSLNL